MNRFYRLLAYGYFPKELPPIFSTRSFARSARQLTDVEFYGGSKWQRPCHYLLQQRQNYKRRLDIIGPHSILKQAYAISGNYREIAKIYNEYKGNCSRPSFNRKTKFQRAVRPFAIGRRYSSLKLDLRSRFPFVLRLDVRNYYRSIYTHAISWALHGRDEAKRRMRDRSLLGNVLDRAFREGQDGQTIGVPTGPDTSFIISEIILSRVIHLLVAERRIEAGRFIRFYDDIEYGCETEEEAHRVLAYFEQGLRDFELEVNADKVQILSGVKDIEKPWLYQLRNIEWSKGLGADELLELFSFVAEIASKYPYDHVFRYFLRKMRKPIVSMDAWEAYEKILLSLLQDNRGNAREIFEQLLLYKRAGLKINGAALKSALHRKIRGQLSRGVTSEMSWALYGLLLFDLGLESSLAGDVLLRGDIPSKVLVVKIIYENRMPLRSAVSRLVDDWDDDVLNSAEWLLAYEVLANNWHSSRKRIRMPSNRQLFDLLVGNKVSFLNDEPLSSSPTPSVTPERPIREQVQDSSPREESRESQTDVEDLLYLRAKDDELGGWDEEIEGSEEDEDTVSGYWF